MNKFRQYLPSLSIKKLLLYFYAFYFFYQPNLTSINPYFKSSLILLLIDIVILLYFRKELINFIKSNSCALMIVFLCLANAYTLLPTIINDINIRNNLTSIIFSMQVIALFGLILFLNKEYFTLESKMKFLINIGLIQSLSCFLMLVFPTIKNIANTLYISNIPNYAESSLYGITLYRIYGISGDYTFSTSIFMAILSSISLILFYHLKEKKFLLFTIILIFSSLLNGRTGFIIFILVSLISTYFYVPKKKFIKYFIVFIMFLCMLLPIISLLVGVEWLNWLLSSFTDIYASIFNSDSSTTINRLFEFTFFPKNLYLIFGVGSRVFGDYGMNLINKMSDIGYINEIWRGGLIYMVLFYSGVAILIKITYKNISNSFGHIPSKAFCTMFILYLFISNYKGEALSGSSILMSFLYIALIFSHDKIRKKRID